METDLESQPSVELLPIDEELELELEDDAATMISEGTSQSGKKKRKKTSKVWNYFTELPLGKDKVQKAKCNKCGTVYNSSSKCGTGSLQKH